MVTGRHNLGFEACISQILVDRIAKWPVSSSDMDCFFLASEAVHGNHDPA
jgi:hypothetical protein